MITAGYQVLACVDMCLDLSSYLLSVTLWLGWKQQLSHTKPTLPCDALGAFCTLVGPGGREHSSTRSPPEAIAWPAKDFQGMSSLFLHSGLWGGKLDWS